MSVQTIEGYYFNTKLVIRLTIDRGRLASIEEIEPQEGVLYPCLAPGFFDLQLNGYAGVDFNRAEPITEADYLTVADALAAQGYTSFCPTLITNSPQALEKRCRELAEILAKNKRLATMTPGFHIEGPYLSPLDGARGAHAREFIHEPDFEEFKMWYDAAGGRISIVTVSPEWGDAAYSFIAKVRDLGVRVSIGHTMATDIQVRAAATAGASLVTHFGNGVPLMVPRHPNFLWEQLAQDRLACSVIADGFHLPESVLKTVFRVKGRSTYIISDSTEFGGMKPGTYSSHVGGEVTLTPAGRLHLAHEPGLLAGSAQSVRHGVAHIASTGILPLKDAWIQASTAPAVFLGMEVHAALMQDAYANFVEFTYEGGKVHITGTWLHGEKIYKGDVQ